MQIPKMMIRTTPAQRKITEIYRVPYLRIRPKIDRKTLPKVGDH